MSPPSGLSLEEKVAREKHSTAEIKNWMVEYVMLHSVPREEVRLKDEILAERIGHIHDSIKDIQEEVHLINIRLTRKEDNGH